MAGRKHHYLPQLIQRPFAYRQQGKECYVHAHHRTHGRFTPNTSGLGKELDFYGGPDDTSLDDAITQGEAALAATVQAINRGDEVAPMDMATLICALAFRTKSMREALVAMFPALIAALRVRLLDIVRLRQDLVTSLTEPRVRKRLIYEQIDKRMGPLPREQRAKVYGTLLSRWKTYVAEHQEQLVAQCWQLTYMMLTKARSEADAIADGGYLKALAKDPAMSIRASRMVAEMAFEILDAASGETFILGDCGPVAVFSDGKPRLLLAAFENEVEMEMVFLPSSPTRCIVCRLPATTMHLRVADINRISAALSLEFFISNRETGEDLEELIGLIGTLDPLDTEEDIVRFLSQQRDGD